MMPRRANTRHRRLYQKDAINWFPRTAGSKNELILRGGPHRKTKQNKTKRKQKHPSDKNCWRLKEKYESCSSRDMNTFLNYNLSCGDLFVTHHLHVKLDFILGQTNLRVSNFFYDEERRTISEKHVAMAKTNCRNFLSESKSYWISLFLLYLKVSSLWPRIRPNKQFSHHLGGLHFLN